MTVRRTAGGTDGGRWDSLDALRGIAAFLVVTFHCAQVSTGFGTRANPLDPAAWLDVWTWLKYTPLRVFVSSGPSAVVLFFALSGFVLALPFLRPGPAPGYAGFVAKRLCRIYAPFAVAILGSAALYAVVRPVPMPALSPWFNTVLWDQPLTPGYVARNLAMTGLTPDMTLDLVMWSLVHELRISLVFPVLFLATLRWPGWSLAASLALGLACTAALAGGHATTIPGTFVDTGRFVFLFVAGILVAANAAAVRSRVAGLPRTVAGLLWLVSVLLLLSPGPSVYNFYDFTWGAGAAGLLVLTVGSATAGRALSARPLVWLGRVSYSLYLVHLPLLVAAIHLADGRLPLAATVPAVVAASLLGADVMHRCVEVPSIRAGRALARRLGRNVARPLPAGARP